MTPVESLLFLAMFVQVVLTLVQYLRLVRARFAAVGAGEADLQRAGFDQSAWPLKARLLSNSVSSKFELPVLFYVAAILTYVLGALGWIPVILAWVFVISRIVHAAIHTGGNPIRPRLGVFVVGFAAVAIYWIWLAIHVVTGWLLLA